MSRIGRNPITVPAGVDVVIAEGNHITVKGALGTLEFKFSDILNFKRDGDVIVIERPVGVKDGFKKTLQINGVGYRAAKSGTTLTLNLGHSHPIYFEEGDGITFELPDSNTIIVKGADKQKVGYIAAQIREKRPPEPYLGKGVKYDYEHIRRKAGKTGK